MIICLWILLFSVFGFFVVLYWCFDLWGYCLSPKTFFFQNGLCFRDCEPFEIYISWSFSNTCDTFLGYISLKLIFLYRFLSMNFYRGCFTCTICIMYNVYICQEYREAWHVVDRNQILCDVTFSDHIVHPTCMVDGLQLQYWHSFLYITFHRQFSTDIDDIVYCIFLNISVILNFNFHSLYMLSLSYRYGS